MTAWPDNLPLPLIVGQSQTITSPVITTEMQAGQPLVRQVFSEVPELRNYRIRVRGNDQYDIFKKHFALNSYGAKFFSMPTEDGNVRTNQIVRYNGVYTETPRGNNNWDVSFQVLVREQNLITDMEYHNLVNPAQPSFSAFAVQGWSSNIANGTNIGGLRNITWSMANPTEVAGNMELVFNGNVIRNDIVPVASGSVQVNIPQTLLYSGQSASAFLQATTSTGLNIVSPTARAESPAATELLYYGSAASNVFTAGLANIFQNAVWRGGTQSLSYPAWTGAQYLFYAQRANRPDLSNIQEPGAGAFGNVTDTFLKSPTTVTVSGSAYEWWVSRFAYNSSGLPNGITLEFTK